MISLQTNIQMKMPRKTGGVERFIGPESYHCFLVSFESHNEDSVSFLHLLFEGDIHFNFNSKSILKNSV